MVGGETFGLAASVRGAHEPLFFNWFHARLFGPHRPVASILLGRTKSVTQTPLGLE